MAIPGYYDENGNWVEPYPEEPPYEQPPDVAPGEWATPEGDVRTGPSHERWVLLGQKYPKLADEITKRRLEGSTAGRTDDDLYAELSAWAAAQTQGEGTPSPPDGGADKAGDYESFGRLWMQSGGKTAADLAAFVAAHPGFGAVIFGTKSNKVRIGGREYDAIYATSDPANARASWDWLTGGTGTETPSPTGPTAINPEYLAPWNEAFTPPSQYAGATQAGPTGYNIGQLLTIPVPQFQAPAYVPPELPTLPTYTPPPPFSYQDFVAPEAFAYPELAAAEPFAYDPYTAPEFVRPTAETVLEDPGYQYRLRAGLGAIEASAAARGVLNTGGTLQDIMKFGQEYGGQEYGNVWNRELGLYGAKAQTGLAAYGANRMNAADVWAKNYGAMLDRYTQNRATATDVWGKNYARELNEYGTNYGKAASTYATNYGVGRDAWENLYKQAMDAYNQKYTQASDIYASQFQAAQNEYAPKLAEWQTNVGQLRTQEQNAYTRAWNEYLNQQDVFYKNQRYPWEKQYDLARLGATTAAG